MVSCCQTLILKSAEYSAFVNFTVKLNSMLDGVACPGFRTPPSRFAAVLYLRTSVATTCKKTF